MTKSCFSVFKHPELHVINNPLETSSPDPLSLMEGTHYIGEKNHKHKQNIFPFLSKLA